VVIKEGALKDRIVRDPVSVPEDMTIPCVIKLREISEYGENIDVSMEGLNALIICNEQITRIRNLGQ